MYSLLLVIIYIAFISLGLPDSLIGAGWPVMHTALHVPIAAAGMITMLIAMGTIVSSILSDRLTHRFGAGLVTAVSVLTTAIALLGFSLSQQFYMLCLWAIPYGMGAGAVDAALNNYVALHYAARHMSWLHSFWGVGAAVSPYIMGFALSSGRGWTGGYCIDGLLQIGLAAVLLLTLPLWRRASQQLPAAEKEAPSAPLHLPQIWRIPGVPFVLAAFFAYSAVEQTTGIWASSYLVQVRQVPVDTAANFASFFYLGITGGRFLSGFVADRFGDRALIRGGTILALAGIGLVALPGRRTRRIDHYRVGLCPDISRHHSRHADELWRQPLPSGNWRTDGRGLPGDRIYAPIIWLVSQPSRDGVIPILFGRFCHRDVVCDGTTE
ncbi:MFS transporter [Schleiferilactobacillus perolens]|uniref:Transporter, major facilitator family protein n=1 Tax=Schleiferilactobacillus perolens DSM 12744 TaxID=1423792 RepID=A0A0R1MLM3_9LACO|nr:MFS transporter [Schleiferilactobacillus perolens]KRL08748.1 transporter, major facilitator family protein [Schleiferilactobacillus perolens DSM 12744]